MAKCQYGKCDVDEHPNMPYCEGCARDLAESAALQKKLAALAPVQTEEDWSQVQDAVRIVAKRLESRYGEA